MSLDIQQTSLFDYGSLDTDTRIFVQEQEAELDYVLKRTSKEIGEILLRVKDRLPHGQYTPWLTSRGISQPTAWRCTQVALGKEIKSFKMNDLPSVEVSEIPATLPAIREAKHELLQPVQVVQPIQQSQPAVVAPISQPSAPIRVIPAYYEEEKEFEPVEPADEEEEEIPHYQLPIAELYHEDVLREAIEKMEEVAPVTLAREETAPQISLPVEEDVKEKHDAHVMRVMGSSDSPEWYTPQGIIDLVCRMFGEIDTDPCSNSHEAPTVPARTLYTKDDDGLAYTWTGKTYLNPPYGTEISKWTDKLVDEYKAGNVTEALALLPARIDTVWFSPLYKYLMCNVRGRLQFANSPYNAPFPCVVVYLGGRRSTFIETFKRLGPIMERIG